MIGGVTCHMLPHLPGVPLLHVNRPYVLFFYHEKAPQSSIYTLPGWKGGVFKFDGKNNTKRNETTKAELNMTMLQSLTKSVDILFQSAEKKEKETNWNLDRREWSNNSVNIQINIPVQL